MAKRKSKKNKIKRRKKKKIRSKRKKIIKVKSKKTNTGELIFKVPKKWAKNAYVDKKKYEKKYKLSIKNNDFFWKNEGKRINWINHILKLRM